MARSQKNPRQRDGDPANPTAHSVTAISGGTLADARATNASRDVLIRELELELSRIRSQASAARLEARAAELELMLRRLQEEPASPSGGKAAGSDYGIGDLEDREDRKAQEGNAESLLASESFTPELRKLLQRAADCRSMEIGETAVPSTARPFRNGSANRSEDAVPNSVPRKLDPTTEPALSGDAKKKRSNEPDTVANAAKKVAPPDSKRGLHRAEAAAVAPRRATERGSRRAAAKASPTRAKSSVVGKKAVTEFSADPKSSPVKPSRKRAAWLLSAISHTIILAILAFCTLTIPPRGDQVTLSAAAVDSKPEVVETFAIEAVEPDVEELADVTDEVDEKPLELSPHGEITVPDLSPQLPSDRGASIANAAFSRLASTTQSALAPKKTKQINSEFFGVQGGGNHFVYLVDSSGSMGSGFNAARQELIRSIRQLESTQRFYVVFFDAEPDYMRLSDVGRDEPFSVPATAENKERLAQWAMSIRIDRGRAPVEPLRFALKLRPDAIFLLSDGEFPARIEELLQTENRYENLFGDSGPISVIHTISYHSDEGESRMKRIAAQNNGHYRYVPKP